MHGPSRSTHGAFQPQSPGKEVMTTWRDLPRPGVVKQHPFLTWPNFMVYKVTNGNFEGDAGF